MQATFAPTLLEWRKLPGLTPYEAAISQMEARVAAIYAGEAREAVWLVEHPPLYTAGTSADAAELLDGQRFPVYATGRGGRHTYHGPGQRVAYVMLNLKNRDSDVRQHVFRLEEWMIRTLARFDVLGERREGRVGIWVVRDPTTPSMGGEREDKIGAIGVRVRRWVTYHGMALNVSADLEHFSGIVPCGIQNHGVTSLQDLGINATMDEVDQVLLETFCEVFDVSPDALSVD